MRHQFSFKLIPLAIATSLALTACGGGGGSSSNSTSSNHNATVAQPATATGVFLDSAVQGIEVFQDGKSLGLTNQKGEYTYFVKGGAVSFKLGSLTLGSTMPKATITPADLTTDTNQVVRILQILQSTDSDNNPDNGINIPKQVFDRFVSSDFQTLLQQDDDSQFEIDLKTKLDTNQQVVSSENAQNHFAKTVETDAITKSAELVALAKQFEGYWEQSCDTVGKEIFQLKQVGNTATLVSTGNVLKRIYQHQDCTGTYEETTYASSDEPLTVKIIGQSNENGKQIIHVLRTETDEQGQKENFVDSLTFTGNGFTGDELTFTRVQSLKFGDTIVTADIKQAVESLVGYWETSCQMTDDDDSEYKSKQEFFFGEKTTDNTMTVTKGIDVYYNKEGCQGTYFVVADIRPEPHTLSDPQTVNGKTSYAVTNSDGERLTINSHLQFSVGSDVFYKTSQSKFDNWFTKADFTKYNNKTVPVVTNMKFDRASGNNLAKLTVTFNTDMNLMDYHTQGAYDPAKSYWLNKNTFVVEFNSYEPNGTITLTGKGFRNSGGVSLAKEVSHTFPAN